MGRTNRINQVQVPTAPETLAKALEAEAFCIDIIMDALRQQVASGHTARQDFAERVKREGLEAIIRWKADGAIMDERRGNVTNLLLEVLTERRAATNEEMLPIFRQFVDERKKDAFRQAKNGQNCTSEWFNATDRAMMRADFEVIENLESRIHQLERAQERVRAAREREAQAAQQND